MLIQWNLYITKSSIFFTAVIVKYMEKDLDITKPRDSEQILPVPWPVVKVITIIFFWKIEVETL